MRWFSLARLLVATADDRGRRLWLGGRSCRGLRPVRATCWSRLQTLVGTHVALLILLAASAPAWIVPANLFGAAHRLRLAAAVAAIGLHALHRDGGGHDHQLRVVDRVDDVLRDGRQQLLVHLVGFLLVRDQRVNLGKSAQPNAL